MPEPETKLDGMYFTFQPRPDQPERFDEQTAFYNSKHTGVTLLVGGNGAGCLSPDQEVFDPVAGVARKVSEIDGDFWVWSYQDGRQVCTRARRPVCLGQAPLYEFTLSNGQSFRATLHHRVLAGDRSWIPLVDIATGSRSLSESEMSLRVCDFAKHARLDWQTAEDYLGRCSAYCHRCGEPLHGPEVVAQAVAALSNDAQAFGLHDSLGSGCTRLSLSSSLPSKNHSFPWVRHEVALSEASSAACSQPFGLADILGQVFRSSMAASHHCLACQRSLGTSFHPGTTAASAQARETLFAFQDSSVEVVSLRFLQYGDYWDFEVPATGNYELAGVIHHNTTSMSLLKAMKFLLEDQPPPRPATPFWIISEGYPMVMDVCWNEKLCGRGMLPACEVQWDRIDWFKPNQNWPFRVPLKPWPGHNPDNYWLLEFKSYQQGRSKMQASSIGGFVFVEQCPFELIVETLRGCRDYNFPGAKIAEFTPIDPALSAPLEQMIAEDRFPKDWAIYRCNTQCAMEAGHVSKEWFEEFFGMVSDEMREVRMTGAFASYEGLIYPGFFRRYHVVDGLKEQLDGMKITRKRSLDWGSGPDNAMVCLWSAKDAQGTYCVYDEYYSTEQDKTYTDHAKEIMIREEWPEDGFHLQTYADPASPGLMRLFAQSGVICTPARNDVYEGIESVRVALKRNADGDPGLIIDSRCTNLIRELSMYRWERPRKSSVNPKNARPIPLKKDDHGVDSLRYLIHTDMLHSRSASVGSKKIVPKNQKRFIG